MRKKTIIYYPVFCLGIIFSFMMHSAVAQDETVNTLTQQFQQSQLQSFQEKIYLHVDKEFYLAGETIWFKIYDVDEYFHLPFNENKVVYAEIIGKDQKPVLQTKIAIDSGTGHGSFQIPSSISSGNYTIRAYSNWMKNFSPDFYFSKQLTIINTLKPTAISETAPHAAYSIRFYPEGGNLVDGLSSKIAFKITNQSNEGVACSGAIINDKKDTITTFKSLHFGTGSFLLTPKNGETYYGVIKINDSVIVQQLPAAYNNGYVMHVTDNGNSLSVSVHSAEKLSSSPVYLIAQTRNVIKNAQFNRLNAGEVSFTLDKKLLGDGISHLTIFNAEKQPVCERLVFKYPENEMIIQAKLNQDSYAQRKKAAVDLFTTDLSGQALQGDLSMSVILIDSLQSVPEQNILNYLLLTSELKGKIESPQYYFDNNDKEAKEAVDNLMLTQGWSRFKWENVLQNKIPAFEFLPETEGILVNGTITDKKTGQPIQNTMSFLSVPGNHFELGTAVSNSSGAVRFNMTNFFGKNDIIIQTNNPTDSNYRIDITNPYSDKFSSSSMPELIFQKKWEHLLLEHSINAQVEGSYLPEKKRGYSSPLYRDTTAFFGKPTLHYNLDDYTRFVTMEEVMREYVTDVRVRKEDNKFNFRVRNSLFNLFFEDKPLVLIDGVPVYDATKIITLDPLKIKSIDVVSHRYYKGALLTDGIVSYKTYNGDLAGYQLDPGSIVLEYDGLQRQKEFYSPVYEGSTDSRIPDFRNVLLWVPDIKTDDNGKKSLSFYTSDLRGNYAIIIQGLTAQGLPGSSVLTFTVD
jgi:hypothetical protein